MMMSLGEVVVANSSVAAARAQVGAQTPRRAPAEFVYVGTERAPQTARLARAIAAVLDVASRLTSRVFVRRWVRYRIDLATAPSSDGIRLTPVDDVVLRRIAAHPDAEHPDVASALRYGDQSLRGGFVWLDDAGDPLCMQWLFTRDDNPALRALPVWSGMYPPLAHRVGQVEKLWTFSTARQKGVATRFARAMFDVARARGLTELRTHIHESNETARHWAQRTGWTEIGTITRYAFDMPGLRRDNATVCVHV